MRRTYILPSLCTRLNLHSSLKTTDFHSEELLPVREGVFGVSDADAHGLHRVSSRVGVDKEELVASGSENREDSLSLCRLRSKFAAPDVIHVASGLPKTRSGKIMRRILRKIAGSEYDGLGDTSTLAEPDVVERLIAEHKDRVG